MTDYPRFQSVVSHHDIAHRSQYGAPAVELVLRVADAWIDYAQGRSSRRPFAAFVVVALAISLIATQALSQEAVRVRGKIEALAGGTYAIRTRDNDIMHVKLTADASVAACVRSSLVDIRPGLYIGIAAVPQSDGSLQALEAHIFHESMRGLAEGHRPWDLLPNSNMTNATVHDVVQAVDGNTVTLKCKGGEQRIVIPAGTVVVTYLPGSAAELKAGAAIFVPAADRQPNGTLLAQRIMVGRDIAPPQ